MSAQQSMDVEKLKSEAAAISLMAAFCLTSLKLGIGLYTNSLAILSEALHSGLDLLAALMTWYAIRISARPADRGHPYGHGKVENLSALGETVLLFVVCLYVGYEGTHRLLRGDSPVLPSLWGVGVMFISMIVDINRVRVLRKVAKVSNSQALEADALHFSTDILSSAVVFVGVLAVWLADFLHLPESLRKILEQADTLAAIIVALLIFRVTLRMAGNAINFLMDAGSEEKEVYIERAVEAVPGVNRVSRLRMRSAGPRYFVDLCVGVDPQLSVQAGHRIAQDVEEAVRGILHGADVTVHVDPLSLQKADEGPYQLIQREAQGCGLSAHDVHILTQEGSGPHIEVVIEFNGASSFRHAFERTKNFEASIRRKIQGGDVVTHLEPQSDALSARSFSPETSPLAAITWKQVQKTVEGQPFVSSPHDFNFYLQPHFGACVSFHCAMNGDLSVKDVHDETVRIEKELREALPVLGRIVIHVEPQ